MTQNSKQIKARKSMQKATGKFFGHSLDAVICVYDLEGSS